MKIKLISTIFIFLPFFASSDTLQFNSLDDVVKVALSNNRSIQEIFWNLEKLESDIPSYWKLDNSSISVEASVQEGMPMWRGAASLTVPVVEQLSLDGKINTDSSGKLNISLLPLSHSDEVNQGKISLALQKAKATQQILLTENTAITATLEWMGAVWREDIQNRRSTLREGDYRELKIRYEGGLATLSELNTALKDWIEARKLVATEREKLRNSRVILENILGIEEFAFHPLPTEEVLRAMESWKAKISPNRANPNASYTLLAENLAMESLQEKLKDTWAFDPLFKVAAIAEWDANGEWAFSANASLNISWNNIQGMERDQLKGDLSIQRKKLIASRREEELQLKQMLEDLETTKINRELTELLVKENEEIEAEAELLNKQGNLSRTEWADVSLDMEEAELAHFEAVKSEFSAWLSLRLYL